MLVYLVFTNFRSGKHTNFIAQNIEQVNDLMFQAFESKDEDFAEQITEAMAAVKELKEVHNNTYFEFSDSTWITVTLSTLEAFKHADVEDKLPQLETKKSYVAGGIEFFNFGPHGWSGVLNGTLYWAIEETHGLENLGEVTAPYSQEYLDVVNAHFGTNYKLDEFDGR